MNARMLRRFDERAAETGEALWPCEIELGGTPYEAMAPKPRVGIAEEFGAQVGSGDLLVRLRKAVHPEEPEREAELRAHGELWVIREVRSNEADACWLVRCEVRN